MLFLVMFSNFLTVPVVREETRVKLALAILTAAPTTLVNEEILLRLLHIKELKLYLFNQKQLHICLSFYCMIFFD